jgi:spore coat protein A
MRAHANEVTVLPSKDTTIYEDDDTLSNGAGLHLFVGLNVDRAPRRALIAFDVATNVPAGATVTKAALELVLTRTQPGVTHIEMHRLLSAWGEGTSHAAGQEGGGAQATDGDATWTYRLWPRTSWGAPGGDYASTSSADLDVDSFGQYVWTSDGLAADVQNFLDHPEKNLGWMLIGDGDPHAVAKRLESRESGLEAPRLVVDFTIAAPAGACCYPDGSCGEMLAPGTGCQGTYAGTGSTCAPGTCPEPTGACCTADAKGTCDVTTKDQCGDGAWKGGGTSCEPDPCPVILTPFVDALPVPVVATPVNGKSGGAVKYHLKIVQFDQQLHRDLPPTKVWGFDDGVARAYPGPTIEARSGEPVEVEWENDLRDANGKLLKQHALAVDECLEGAPTTEPRVVMHLHGGLVAEDSDGYPESTLLPGQHATYAYPNAQRAGALWYHDDAIGIARLDLYMGLAGSYFIRDSEEDALGLPSAGEEVPLVIQDRSFNPDGSLRYPATWQAAFFGDNIVVNGKVSPYLTVTRGLYRFRVVNASTSRTYTLSLSDGRYFFQIGNDGGLLPESVPVYSVTIMPGERADIVVDFTYAESPVILKNSAVSPYPAGGSGPDLTNVLRFNVVDTQGYFKAVPRKLSKVDPMPESAAARTRDFDFDTNDTDCGSTVWAINGDGWSDMTEKPHLGTTEIWRFINHTGNAQPIHLHALYFQVLDRQAFRFVDDNVVPQGDPQLPDPTETGWKDTVEVGPFQIVRVIASFDGFTGRYPYHSALLEQEDHGMLRQMEAVAVCGDGARARNYEECDDGNRRDGDGCDHDCRVESASGAAGDSRATGTTGAVGSAGMPAAAEAGAGGTAAEPIGEGGTSGEISAAGASPRVPPPHASAGGHRGGCSLVSPSGTRYRGMELAATSCWLVLALLRRRCRITSDARSRRRTFRRSRSAPVARSECHAPASPWSP